MRKILVLIAVATVVLVVVGIAHLRLNEGKFSSNNERAGFMLLKGGYRAYWIRYSEGCEYPYRRWRDNLWCWPRFERCDVRKLVKEAAAVPVSGVLEQ